MSCKRLVASTLLLTLSMTAIGKGQTRHGEHKKKPLHSKQNKVRRAATWQLGRNLSMLALLRAQKPSNKTLQSLKDDVHRLGATLHVEIPKMRPLTGERPKDFASALGYLLREGGPRISRGLRRYRNGDEYAAIFELGTKSSILVLIYAGDPNDNTVKGTCAAMQRLGKQSTIPSHLWKPIVAAGGRKMAQAELKRRVRAAQAAIEQHLKKEAGVGILEVPLLPPIENRTIRLR